MTLFQVLFGCSHSNYSRVFTRRRERTRAKLNEPPTFTAKASYVVCLDCGLERNYDLEKMRIVPPNKPEQIKQQPRQAQIVEISTRERRARFR